MTQKYNDPIGGTPSTIGPQMREFLWNRQAIEYVKDVLVFANMSDTTGLPKHTGKTIKKYKHFPIISDVNTYAFGLDANGDATTGNLSGSSRDLDTVMGAMPTLNEVNGRVNKVGRIRKTVEASIFKYGMFMEYTRESQNFDTEANLLARDRKELAYAAAQVYDDLLQIDIINSAEHEIFGGAATTDDEISGDTGNECALTFQDLEDAQETLDDVKCPTSTSIIDGIDYTDTRVVDEARYMITSAAMDRLFRRMTDTFGERAYISREQYAGAGWLAPKESGTIANFRIIKNQRMLTTKGAEVTDNAGFRETADGKYEVHHGLVIGSSAYSTIGFKQDAVNDSEFMGNFEFKHSDPECTTETPFGDVGVLSVQFWYGTLFERPEWLMVLKSPVPANFE